MKPRFCTSPLGVSDAIEAAWRTYSMIYDKPDEQVRLALETYINRLVARRAKPGPTHPEGDHLPEEARAGGRRRPRRSHRL